MASAEFQIRINGGALTTVDEAVAEDVISFHASSFAGWQSGRWEMPAFPPGFPAPAGWSTDASNGRYYYLANSVDGMEPPDVTLPTVAETEAGQWGKWLFDLLVNGTIRASARCGVNIVSPALGLKGKAFSERTEFGGTTRAFVGDEQHDAELIDDAALAGTMVYVAGTGLTESPAGTFNVGVHADGGLIATANEMQLGALGFTRVQTALAAASGSIAVNAQKITGLAAGVNPTDAANVSQISGSTYVAGAGLAESPALTFNVGANADGSIAVNANDIQVGILATDAQHGNRGGGALHANVIAGGTAGFMSGTDKTKLDGFSALDSTNPADVSNTATPGVSTVPARRDHVHDLPFSTLAAVLTEANAAMAVNNQSFTKCTSVSSDSGLTLSAGGGNSVLDATAKVDLGHTSATEINLGHDTIPITATGNVEIVGTQLITKNAVGTASTVASTLSNTTAATVGTPEQYSPIHVLAGTSYTGSASEIQEFGFQVRGTGGRNRLFFLRRAGGAGAWSTFAVFDEQDTTYGANCMTVGGGVSDQGFGWRLANNGGGIKESSSRFQIVSSLTSDGILIDVALATGDSDSCLDLLSSAGTPTAGKFLRVGYGSGSFSTEVFSISRATATMGQPSINGINQGYWRVTNDTSTTLNVVAGDTGKLFTLSNAGAVTVNLPAGAAGLRFWFKNKGAGTATLTPNGAEKLFTNAQVSTYALATGDSTLIAWDGTDWSVIA